MIQVIVNRRSETARDLQLALSALPDLVGLVNWTGAPMEEEEGGGLILNQFSSTNKLRQLERLREAGLNVPNFSRTYYPGCFPRTIHHQQGRDFTHLMQADYWVEYTPVVEEWRIHVFKSPKGKHLVIRSGIRVPRLPRHHPWVRSHRLGWKISYTGGAPELLKDAAKKAVAALNLDFGAVDLGRSLDGGYVIFEVNTCPGLERGTLGYYVDRILARFRGGALSPS